MKKLKSLLLLTMTAMIWGFAFVAQRVGADYIKVFTFNGLRFLLGGVSLIPVIAMLEKRSDTPELHRSKLKMTVLSGLLAGFVLFTASALQQKGIELTGSAGKTGFMTALYTVIVPIIGVLCGKKTSLNVWLGAFLSVFGMFFLCVVDESWSVSWQVGIGDAVLLLNAVFWALHILVIDKFVGRIYSLRFAMTQFLFCGALSLLVGVLGNEETTPQMLQNALVPILYCGLLSVGVAYTCQIIAQKDADPTYASIVLSTESMFSAIGGMLILNERMSIQGYIGCALIFGGVIISQLKLSGRKNAA